MNINHLIWREIGHRKLNFMLALVSVTVAVACLVGALTMLKADDIETERILTDRQADVKKAGDELKDAMRKITLGLGFNVLILPEDQDTGELQLSGPTKFMPESLVDKLASSNIVTINHLLPTISQHVEWPERQEEIVLVGTRGEVPFMHKDPKKPMLDAVPAGTIVVGSEIARRAELKVDQETKLMDKTFRVTKVHEPRGTLDDVSVWVNLGEAQQMLGKENLINGILALECNCGREALSKIREEIAGMLPGTKVVEFDRSGRLARTEARAKAAEDAKQSLAVEEASRQALEDRRQRLAAVLVPLVALACALWVGLLTLSNVRERTAEIGILRAIGLSSWQVLLIFLGKAAVVGTAGAVVGYLLGYVVVVVSAGTTTPATSALFMPWLIAMSLGLALALTLLASWIPARLAARQDPAIVLQRD